MSRPSDKENEVLGAHLGSEWIDYGVDGWQAHVFPHDQDYSRARLVVSVHWWGKWFIAGIGYCRNEVVAAKAANLLLAATRVAL